VKNADIAAKFGIVAGMGNLQTAIMVATFCRTGASTLRQ
jgi:hypothetical protein